MNRPTIVFDFDGVIHSYNSGWKGVDVIPDPPVEGIADVMQKLLDNGYDVMILSTRCEIKEARLAMEKWLKQYNIPYTQIIAHKVPALVYVDDRGLKFDGNHVERLFDSIVNFKTWMEVQ